MTTYKFAPNSTNQIVSWDDPTVWSSGSVPNSRDVDVVFPTFPNLPSGYAQTYIISIKTGESFNVASLELNSNYLVLNGSLAVDGKLALNAGGEIDMHGGSLSLGSLQNAGIDIQGSGQISSAGDAVNEGTITGSGLTLSFNTFRNTGQLIAMNQLTLDVTGPSGSFANFSNGTLTGGTYQAITPGTLNLNIGGVVTTDAATIILGNQYASALSSDTINMFDRDTGSYRPIQSTLQTIASTGTLTLYSEKYTTEGPLTVAGLLQILTGSAVSSSQFTVSAGGKITGAGTVTGAIVNDGIIASQDLPTSTNYTSILMPLVIHGSVSGGGRLEVGSGYKSFYGLSGAGSYTNTPSVLELDGAIFQDVSFTNPIGSLVLDAPQSFKGRIGSFTGADQVFLSGITLSSVTGYSYTGDASSGVLTIQAAGSTFSLGFAGSYMESDFVLMAGPQQLSTSPPSLAVGVAKHFVISATDAVKADAATGTAFTAYTFQVTRTGDTAKRATMNFSVAGSGAAPAPSDLFAYSNGNVSFLGGAAATTLTVYVKSAVLTADEGFIVTLSGAPDGTSITTATATGTILHNTEPALVGYQDAITGQGGTTAMSLADAGGPSYLQWQYIYAGKDDLALSTQVPNVFIHSGNGNDAIQVTSGQNVLDGGLGSNFLTGGTGPGTDTFFTDARTPAVVWNTIRNFHADDAATLWGFTAGVSSYRWEPTTAGAPGSEGATLRANIVGGAGRAGDGIDASITFTGFSVDQAKGFQIVTGTQPAGNYLYIYNPGV